MRTKVGDRYVIEEMVERNLNLGGEQSGHMIFRDFTTTGDGIISALQILRIMKSSGKPLSELKRCLTKYPQAQRNLKVKEKPPLEDLPAVMKLVGEAEKELSGKGRVFLRYSGTEPKIRLLIEGRELEQIDRQANRIARGDSERDWSKLGRMCTFMVLCYDAHSSHRSAAFQRAKTAHDARAGRGDQGRRRRRTNSCLTNLQTPQKRKWRPRSNN